MKLELRAKIIAYNRTRAEDKQKADDLITLLHTLPYGQVKQLLKDETCAAIMRKYGIVDGKEMAT